MGVSVNVLRSEEQIPRGRMLCECMWPFYRYCQSDLKRAVLVFTWEKTFVEGTMVIFFNKLEITPHYKNVF